ncbi:hypothetical protein [Legionella genomosp. 1]|uniref:hypothetical protein n=1 Tax=Legionella genomosp. 1 TaxID=1093625 RepID=UPI001056397D|nr:hypothetical protein [Legionella genomosp. 1]
MASNKQFKLLSENQFISRIRRETAGRCEMMQKFIYIYSSGEKGLKKAPLQSQYDTIYRNLYETLDDQSHLKFWPQVQEKLSKNHIIPHPSGTDIHKDASFKLHVNLNDIGNLDQNTLLGLIDFINKESWAHNVNEFKVISPELHNNERFKNSAQLTIYMNNYASVADLISLSEKINTYLLQHKVPENQITDDLKSSVGLNSFVSGRFDTNKVNKTYGQYPFMDKEIAKFFEKHKDNKELEKIPLCAFDAIFNKIIYSKSVNNLRAPGGGLSKADSKKVQLEFEKMLNNPRQYIKDMSNLEKNGLDSQLNEEQQKDQRIEERLTYFTADFSDCDTASELAEKVAQEKNRFQQLVSNLEPSDKNKYRELLHRKEMSIDQQAQQHQKQLDKSPIDTQKLSHFKALLSNLERLSESEGPDKHRIKKYCSLMRGELQSFKEGKLSFNDFHRNCKTISEQSGLIKKPSWSEKIQAILTAALSFGLVPLYRRYNGKPKDASAPEDSPKEKLKRMRVAINDLKAAENQTSKEQGNTENRSTELAPSKISL